VSTNASLSRTVQLGDTRSFEARVTATNVFNTVQYSGINTTENSANFGEVTSAAAMRSLQVQARYRF
jgi:trimeric autotransporter adhesin